MPAEFKRFIDAELSTMMRDLGEDALGDVELLNRKAVEWIRENAVRFRAEWDRTGMIAECKIESEACE